MLDGEESILLTWDAKSESRDAGVIGVPASVLSGPNISDFGAITGDGVREEVWKQKSSVFRGLDPPYMTLLPARPFYRAWQVLDQAFFPCS